MWRYVVLVIQLVDASAALGQSSQRFELAALGGFLMPHHDDMLYLIDGHITGVEAAWHSQTDGSKEWHHHFNFPTWGISASWYDLGSKRLGQSASANAFLDLPISRNRKLSFMMGIGMGFISEPFDIENNFQNGAIGSHLNASLELSLLRQWALGPRLRLRAGPSIRHFSNGAMRLPNSGINIAVAKVSIQYLTVPEKLPERLHPEYVTSPWQYFVGSSFGMKEVLPIGGPKYGVVNVFGSALKRVSRKSSLGVEAGINYNSSLSSRAINAGREPTGGENLRPFAAGQYALHFGPVALRLQVGSYLFPVFEDDGLVFFKYHLVYERARWQAFIGLKSHFAKADNGELGIAYRIR